MIDEREVRRVVAVDRLAVRTVVPVMEIRRHDQVLQRAPGQAHVGVVENGLEADHDDVCIHHLLRETQHIERPQYRDPGEHQFQQVHARAGDPVHGLGAVMHRMESPQEWHLVISPVRGVLQQVGHQQDQQQFERERQGLDGLLQRRVDRPAEEPVDQEIDREQDQADQEMVDDEVHEIGLPLGPEHRLLAIERKELFDQHEDQRRTQQIEDEPVQTHIRCVVREIAHRHLMAAQCQRDAQQEQAGQIQPAGAAQHQIAQADHAAQHHGPQHHLAQQVDRVFLAQLGRGQVLGKMKGQHTQKAQDRQREPDHAGDAATSRAQFAGLPEQAHYPLDELHRQPLRTVRHRPNGGLDGPGH